MAERGGEIRQRGGLGLAGLLCLDTARHGNQHKRGTEGGVVHDIVQINAANESHDVSPWCTAFSETCAIARNPLVQRGCDPKIKSKSLEIGPKRFNAE